MAEWGFATKPIANVVGQDVWLWPEWEAFADRLGIERGLPTKSVRIRLEVDSTPIIEHEYIGRNANPTEEAMQ